MTKVKLKIMLIDLGVWGLVQKLRSGIFTRYSSYYRGHSKLKSFEKRFVQQNGDKDTRAEEIYIETGKIILKVLTRE